MGSDEIVRVLDQLFLGQHIDEVFDRACADQSKSDTSSAFNHRKGALDQDTQLKNLMNPFFVHAYVRIAESLSRQSHRLQNQRESFLNDIIVIGFRDDGKFDSTRIQLCQGSTHSKRDYLV